MATPAQVDVLILDPDLIGSDPPFAAGFATTRRADGRGSTIPHDNISIKTSFKSTSTGNRTKKINL